MSQVLTFECGRCSSVYRLSQDDLGASGAKITCPKCYSFFYLKPPRDDIKPPIIEKIASRDGEYEDNPPPPLPGEKTTEKILSEAIESLSYPAIKDEQPVYRETNESMHSEDNTDSLIQHHVPMSIEDKAQNTFVGRANEHVESLWNQDVKLEKELHNIPDQTHKAEKPIFDMGLEEVTGNFYDPETIITQDSLSDYPEDPPETTADRSIVWLAALALAIVAVLFAHYNRSLTIPFLEQFQKPLPEKNDLNQNNQPVTDPSSKDVKYGFPEAEAIDESELAKDADPEQTPENDSEQSADEEAKP